MEYLEKQKNVYTSFLEATLIFDTRKPSKYDFL